MLSMKLRRHYCASCAHPNKANKPISLVEITREFWPTDAVQPLSFNMKSKIDAMILEDPQRRIKEQTWP